VSNESMANYFTDTPSEFAELLAENNAFKSRIKELEEREKILRACVEFYARKSVWGIAMPSDLTSIDPCDVEEFFHQEIGIMHRGGKKARETLKQLGEK
jgi:hypothetical protein